MSSPFPSPTFAKQTVSITIPVPPDVTKFRVRLFIAEGASPASAVSDQFDIFDCQLNLDSTGYGTPQGGRTVGPEPGLQFARPAGGNTICQFGDYIAVPGSVFALWCPENTIAGIDIFLISWATGAFAALSSNWISQSIRDQYGVRRGGQLVTRSAGSLYLLNVADPAYQNYLFSQFFPAYLAANGPNFRHGITSDAAHPTLVTVDAWESDYGTWGATPWDTGYAQSRDEWYAGIDAWFKYAKDHCPQIRLAPHIGSMEDASLATFQRIYGNCPVIMKEWFQLSATAGLGGGPAAQVYAQILNLHWFANVAPPLFAGDPPTRIVMYGVSVDNHDYETALALYCQSRGPNTFFDLLVGGAGVDPAIWLPTANKLGAATSGPESIIGSGASSVLRRIFAGGVAYLNLGAGTQTITPPAGATDWAGTAVTSIVLENYRGRVVLVGTPVSAGVRPTRTAVIVGSDGTVTNPSLAIDKDSDPPVTAATIMRTDFSVSTVGSVLELSGFGG